MSIFDIFSNFDDDDEGLHLKAIRPPIRPPATMRRICIAHTLKLKAGEERIVQFGHHYIWKWDKLCAIGATMSGALYLVKAGSKKVFPQGWAEPANTLAKEKLDERFEELASPDALNPSLSLAGFSRMTQLPFEVPVLNIGSILTLGILGPCHELWLSAQELR